MATAVVMREKLANYLKVAYDKSESIYTMVENEITISENDFDVYSIKELNKRCKDAAK